MKKSRIFIPVSASWTQGGNISESYENSGHYSESGAGGLFIVNGCLRGFSTHGMNYSTTEVNNFSWSARLSISVKRR